MKFAWIIVLAMVLISSAVYAADQQQSQLSPAQQRAQQDYASISNMVSHYGDSMYAAGQEQTINQANAVIDSMKVWFRSCALGEIAGCVDWVKSWPASKTPVKD